MENSKIQISKNKIKLLASLKTKKFRNQNKLFIIEGVKIVNELLNSTFQVEFILIENDFKLHEIIKEGNNSNKIKESAKKIEILNSTPLFYCTKQQMKKCSSLINPPGVLALVKYPSFSSPTFNQKSLYLQQINDPGNLGTIIRTADWFGIKQVIIGGNSVDIYNPKVIQSSMGSFFRVNLIENNLEDLDIDTTKVQIFVADMNGTPIQDVNFPENLILAIGNESHGVKPIPIKHERVTIPKAMHSQAESLNASIACAIICSYL